MTDMRLNKWNDTGSERQSRIRKTIREWEQEYGIFILDLDGFDQTNPKLYDALFTRREFEQAAAECTILQKKRESQPDGASEKAPQREFAGKRQHQQKRHMQAEPTPRKTPWWRRVRRTFALLFFLFPLPAVATVLVHWIYTKIKTYWNVPWYVPVAILATDLFLWAIQPWSPIISGPGYVGYIVLNELASLLHGSVIYIKEVILHRPPGLTAVTPTPFLSSVSLAGNAVPLYFTLGSALASSLFYGTVLTVSKDLVSRLINLLPIRSTFRRTGRP